MCRKPYETDSEISAGQIDTRRRTAPSSGNLQANQIFYESLHDKLRLVVSRIFPLYKQIYLQALPRMKGKVGTQPFLDVDIRARAAVLISSMVLSLIPLSKAFWIVSRIRLNCSSRGNACQRRISSSVGVADGMISSAMVFSVFMSVSIPCAVDK